MEKELTLKSVPVEMQERIKAALNNVWQAIGPDILNAYDEESGTRERATLKRSEVIDIVLDHGYGNNNYSGDKEAMLILYKLSWGSMQKIAKEAFPHKVYGW